MPLNPNRDSFAVSGLDGNFFFITSGPLKQLKFPCPSVTTDPPSKSPTTPRLPKLEKRGPPEDLLPIQNTEIRISPPDSKNWIRIDFAVFGCCLYGPYSISVSGEPRIIENILDSHLGLHAVPSGFTATQKKYSFLYQIQVLLHRRAG